MNFRTYRTSLIAVAATLPLFACGGTDSGYSAESESMGSATITADSIKLSGPLALSTVSSDAPSADGTVAISDTMATFPSSVLADFATRFPSVTAEERYRKITYSGGSVVDETYGIEGDGADESVEVRANYNASGNFLASEMTSESATIPAAVSAALAALYPGMSVDEAEALADQNGAMTYLVEIEMADRELELTLDDTGTVLIAEEEISASQVPAAVLANLQQELSGLSEAEYEMITDNATGSVFYKGEFKSVSESISVQSTESGEIISIEYEEDL